MADFIKPTGGYLEGSPGASSSPELSRYKGVHGWLLILCVMLTVVGPLIASGLMINRYVLSEPYFAGFRGLQVAIYLSIALGGCSMVYGVYAGRRLWSIQSGAVDTAKRALLFGLAVDIVTAALQYFTWPTSTIDGQMLDGIVMPLVPDLIFFTTCFAYLNKSTRVQITYQL